MSFNINIKNIDYQCIPMMKDNSEKKETIAWMCNKKPVKTVNTSYSCPVVTGSRPHWLSGSNYSTICNWNGLSVEQCRSVDGIMNGNICQKTARNSCPNGTIFS